MLYDHKTRAFGAVRTWKGQDGKTYRDVHKGDDFAETYGNDPFPAIQPGKVIAKFRSGTYGNLLWVRRDKHVVVKYHMLDEPSEFKVGDTINVGDVVGLTGASADNANGNHGHLQVEYDGVPVSPSPYIIRKGKPASGNQNSKPFEEDDMFDAAAEQRMKEHFTNETNRLAGYVRREARARWYVNIDTGEMMVAKITDGYIRTITNQSQIDSLKANGYLLIATEENPQPVDQLRWDNIIAEVTLHRRSMFDAFKEFEAEEV